MKDDARSRLNKMLETDKEDMNEGSRNAAIRDFTHVAKEYFEPDGDLALNVKRARTHWEITVTFKTQRIKNFTLIK